MSQTLPQPSRPRLSKLSAVLAAIGVCAGLTLAAAPGTARADSIAEVQQLAAGGHLDDAMKQLDRLVAANPKDPQYRFMRGVLLTEQHKTPEAIQAFSELTDQFPELPEPYNNLAVLYAQEGQFDKARAALEMAIRTNPSYSTAFENLGDVYAKLASQSYQKALQLSGTKDESTQAKLQLIRQLFSKGGEVQVQQAAATPPAPVRPVITAEPVAPKPAVVAPPVAPRPVAATAAIAPKPAPSAAPAAAGPAAHAAAPAASTAPDVDSAAVDSAVHSWARAWAAKDLDGYFAAYASSYAPAGQSHGAWAAQRKARIAGKGRINVGVEHLEIHVDGDQASAHFRQIYTSGALKFNSPKTLKLERKHGHWVIVDETVG
jgi:regulator of sirC expression with transglutaminase-like and TPR domain